MAITYNAVLNGGTWTETETQAIKADLTALDTGKAAVSHTHAASDVTSGQLAIANGGTGQATANAGLNALLPSQSGHNGKTLQTDGTDTSWVTPASGDVVGPASSADGRIPLFADSTGKLLKSIGLKVEGGTGLYAISTDTAAAGSQIDINPMPGGSGNVAAVRLGRATETSDGIRFQIIRGDNSASPLANHELRGIGDSRLAENNGNVGIGTGTIARKLDVFGTGRFSGLLEADGGITLPAQVANAVLAGPTTGSAAAPAFRALVAGDLPSHTHAASDILLTRVEEEFTGSTSSTITLSQTPATGLMPVLVWKNGIKQRAGSGKDFTRSGATITLLASRTVDDIFEAIYHY